MKLGAPARSLKSLEKTADKWFSYYIRLRDADSTGQVKCVTCGSTFHWNELDCGHFSTRNHKINRYREQNCHPQCTSCNQFKKGEQFKHGQYIDKKYGPGTADFIMSLEHQIFKRTPYDLECIIQE